MKRYKVETELKENVENISLKSPHSCKIRSPKSFIKKIRSSSSSLRSNSSFQSIPLTQIDSFLSDPDPDEEQIGLDLQKDFEKKMDKQDGMEDDLFEQLNRNSSFQIVKKIKKHKEKKDKKNLKQKENEEDESEDKKNQLFQKNPSEEFVHTMIRTILGDHLNNPHYQFSRKTLEEKHVVEKMREYLPELKKYYLKCKHQKYLENIDSKKIITLFRQLIRPFGYQIQSIEKYQHGSKFLLYHFEKMKKRLSPKKMNYVIDFD